MVERLGRGVRWIGHGDQRLRGHGEPERPRRRPALAGRLQRRQRRGRGQHPALPLVGRAAQRPPGGELPRTGRARRHHGRRRLARRAEQRRQGEHWAPSTGNVGAFPCGYRPGIYFFVDEDSPAGGIVSVDFTVDPSLSTTRRRRAAFSDPSLLRRALRGLARGADAVRCTRSTTSRRRRTFDWVLPIFRGAARAIVVVFRWTGRAQRRPGPRRGARTPRPARRRQQRRQDQLRGRAQLLVRQRSAAEPGEYRASTPPATGPGSSTSPTSLP